MLRLVAAVGTLLLLAVPVHAQSGSVAGTVVDESGGVVPGATVVLVGAGARQTTISGARGEESCCSVPGTCPLHIHRKKNSTPGRRSVRSI